MRLPFAVQQFMRSKVGKRLLPVFGEADMSKWVYTFGDGAAEGRASDRNLLGGKGANLAEMCSLGLPVPPGFTITTQACNRYYATRENSPKAWPARLKRPLRILPG